MSEQANRQCGNKPDALSDFQIKFIQGDVPLADVPFSSIPLFANFQLQDGFWYRKQSEHSAEVLDAEHPLDCGTWVGVDSRANVIYWEVA